MATEERKEKTEVGMRDRDRERRECPDYRASVHPPIHISIHPSTQRTFLSISYYVPAISMQVPPM